MTTAQEYLDQLEMEIATWIADRAVGLADGRHAVRLVRTYAEAHARACVASERQGSWWRWPFRALGLVSG